MENEIIVIIIVAVIVALSTLSHRVGIAPPLILMLVGVGVSFLPFIDFPVIEPHWILAIILPPLLYGAAIAIPTVDLRRDFAAIGGMAVILVVVSSVAIGFLFYWLLPGVSLPLGIAMGAILSPTDAVATTIAKGLGVPSRVGVILQGESLFNDATALVLLRSAIAAVAASVSLWHVVADFLWAALSAAAIGACVGWVGVRLRTFIHESGAATAVSLLLPFVAYVPAELVEASGLVAVVAAGLVVAHLSPKHIDARQRLSERANWHTVEFLLEGAVFLGMNLELHALIVDVRTDHGSLWLALMLAGLSIVIIVVLRGGFLALLLQRTQAKTNRMAEVTERIQADEGAHLRARMENSRRLKARMQKRDLRTRVKRYFADAHYLMVQRLGAKEGVLLTWAGMRGVVTLAAAQTLPWSTPHRSLLIVIAFFVAAGSLLLQGGTLSFVIKGLGLAGQSAAPEGEWARLQEELAGEAEAYEPTEAEAASQEALALAQLRAKRVLLLELRSTATYSSDSLTSALTALDAEELAILVRLAGDE